MRTRKEKMEEKTDSEKAQEFIKEYQELCEKYGMRISVSPAFKARDDGSWSVVLQTRVEKLPQEK